MRLPRRCLTLVLLSLLPTGAAAESWPTKAHDVRRTGQSLVVGPAGASLTGTFVAEEGVSINIAPTVSSQGEVYFGTWGIVRSFGEEDPRRWEKLDGKLYKVNPSDMSPAWPEPFPADPVPYCYDYQGRTNPAYCPYGGEVSWYNGTVEGTATLSQDEATVYVGRGDGKLYAVDTSTGAPRWVFRTFNPLDPEDPDGGGEVIGGPLLAPDGTLYFATVAAGPYETNALYAVTSQGELLWRHPEGEASLPQVVWAAPALSPDGGTVYFAGSWGPVVDERDPALPGTVYAVDVSAVAGGGLPRVKWTLDPHNEADPTRPRLWSFLQAVGSDGTLYLGGFQYAEGSFGTAALFALTDEGDHASYRWPAPLDIDGEHAAMVYGLALREESGVTTRVYAASGNGYGLFGYPTGGQLYAIDAQTAAPIWAFDPMSYSEGGSMTGIALDGEGGVFTGVSGTGEGGGTVFSLSADGDLRWQTTVGGLLEWGHPVLGPGGDLFFAESRRCFWFFMPIEDGLCDDVNIDPALYVVYAASPPEEPGGCSTRSACGECSTRSGASAGWGWVVAGLWVSIGRRAGRGRSLRRASAIV